MKIGITGGTGFIGQYLIREYSDRYEFIVTTRKDDVKSSDNVRYVKTTYNIDELENIFSGCDAVVHLCGDVIHGMEYSMNVEPCLTNISLASNVFEICRKLQIKNVINASSVAVYDQIDEKPISESGYCQPNSIYGVSKVAIEKIAEIYNRRYNMKIKSLRFGQGLGISDIMYKKQFWTILLQKCIEKKPITLYGKGITGRDVIYVKDMARAIDCAIMHPEQKGVFNIGTGVISSNEDIAKAYCKAFDNDAGIEYRLDYEESGIRTCMDCYKAYKYLDFVAAYNLNETAIDICEEYKKKYSSIKFI